MSTLGNVIWFIFGGWFTGLLWMFYGLLVLVFTLGIGYPLAVACFRIGKFSFFPFGKTLVRAEDVGEQRVTGTAIVNFIWIILCGLWLAIAHIMAACMTAVTIIGLPFAWVHLKLAAAGFAPLGKRIVSTHVADEINRRKASAHLDSRLCSK